MKDGLSYPSTTHRVRTSCGNVFITIVVDNKRIKKVLCSSGKAGGCLSGHLKAFSSDMDAILRISHISERLPFYTEKTGITCSEAVCCIDKITRCIMNKDLELSEGG